MSRSAILFIFLLVIIVGGVMSLSFIDTEVQPTSVEKPIPNEQLGL